MTQTVRFVSKEGDWELWCSGAVTQTVIFVSEEGDWEPPLGSYLGDLKDEIGGSDCITELILGVPKTYGYRMANVITLIDHVDHYGVNRDSTRHKLARTDKIVRNKKQL